MKNTTGTGILANHLVRALVGQFKHSPRTDMAKKQLNNKDFVALCMFAYGPMGSRELSELASAWRGDKKVLNAYFTPHFGHTATDRTGQRRYGGVFSNANESKLWYRANEHQDAVKVHGNTRVKMQPYANDLTWQGTARCKELLNWR